MRGRWAASAAASGASLRTTKTVGSPHASSSVRHQPADRSGESGRSRNSATRVATEWLVISCPVAVVISTGAGRSGMPRLRGGDLRLLRWVEAVYWPARIAKRELSGSLSQPGKDPSFVFHVTTEHLVPWQRPRDFQDLIHLFLVSQ